MKPLRAPENPQESDLYTDVYGDAAVTDPATRFSDRRQIWHDQHLTLRGPIVATVEAQFVDRWMDAGSFVALSDDSAGNFGEARLSNSGEIRDATTLVPLPDPDPVAPLATGTATVQLWRTIPVRARAGGSAYPDHDAIFSRGKFTVLAGYARGRPRAVSAVDLRSVLLEPTLRAAAQCAPTRPDQAGPQHHHRPAATRRRLAGVPVDVGRFAPRSPRGARCRRRLDRPRPPTGQRVEPVGPQGVASPAHQGGRPWHLCSRKAHTYDASLMVCGSANINRRSLTGDSEIACAVLDAQSVRDHQHRLWALLFPGQPWPKDAQGQDIDLDSTASTAAPGEAFHTAFRAAAAAPTSFLTPDRWQTTTYNLPNGVERDGHVFDWDFNFLYNNFVEASSLPLSIEDSSRDPDGSLRDATLADVAARITAGEFTVPAR